MPCLNPCVRRTQASNVSLVRRTYGLAAPRLSLYIAFVTYSPKWGDIVLIYHMQSTLCLRKTERCRWFLDIVKPQNSPCILVSQQSACAESFGTAYRTSSDHTPTQSKAPGPRLCTQVRKLHGALEHCAELAANMKTYLLPLCRVRVRSRSWGWRTRGPMTDGGVPVSVFCSDPGASGRRSKDVQYARTRYGSDCRAEREVRSTERLTILRAGRSGASGGMVFGGGGRAQSCIAVPVVRGASVDRTGVASRRSACGSRRCLRRWALSRRLRVYPIR
ncbi:hypothetical protein C2E23DRAFT_539194 [Lenzites betulinus]|nr:hypothetical protein C2E23DRAFT_539194 [Lenzites betulinus]